MGLRPIPGTEVPGYDIAPVKGAAGAKQEDYGYYVEPVKGAAGVKQDRITLDF